MSLTTTRRGFLRGLPALVVGNIDPAPSLAMSTVMRCPMRVAGVIDLSTATTGPITQEDWYREMRRIGWTPNAAVHKGKPVSVIEWGPRNVDGQLDYEAFWAVWGDHRLLCKRVSKSGPDFWPRTAQWLFDRGYREPLVPVVGRRA